MSKHQADNGAMHSVALISYLLEIMAVAALAAELLEDAPDPSDSTESLSRQTLRKIIEVLDQAELEAQVQFNAGIA